jgi:hypothetical protein
MSLPHEQPYMSRDNASGVGGGIAPSSETAALSAAAVSANVQAGL